MYKFNHVTNWNQLLYEITADAAVDFLYENLNKFGDTKTAIKKSIEYALSEEPGKGGELLIARLDNEIAGIVVLNKTGMSEYIPDNILVYIAVREDLRGKGLGTMMLEEVRKEVKTSIALHVEYNNPARHLYERMGFKSKYAEMRFDPKESYHDYP